jgi:hypothetical protein
LIGDQTSKQNAGGLVGRVLGDELAAEGALEDRRELLLDAGDDPALLAQWWQRDYPVGESGAPEMMDAYTGRCLRELARQGVSKEDGSKVIRVFTWCTHTDQGVLEAALINLSTPDCGLANLAGATRRFCEQNITIGQLVDCALGFREVHLLHVREIEARPRNVPGP